MIHSKITLQTINYKHQHTIPEILFTLPKTKTTGQHWCSSNKSQIFGVLSMCTRNKTNNTPKFKHYFCCIIFPAQKAKKGEKLRPVSPGCFVVHNFCHFCWRCRFSFCCRYLPALLQPDCCLDDIQTAHGAPYQDATCQRKSHKISTHPSPPLSPVSPIHLNGPRNQKLTLSRCHGRQDQSKWNATASCRPS